MTKKTDSKSDPKSDSKPRTATRIDPTPKRPSAASRAASPLHSGDDPGAMPPHTTADTAPDPDAAVANPDPAAAAASTLPEPAIDPIPAPVVPVPDPSPSPEPHQPSGADEIMRRHRLVDPGVAEAKTEAGAAAAEEDATKGDDDGKGTKDSKGTAS